MNISKPIKFVLTTIILLTFSNFSFCQKLEPKDRPQEPDHAITSKIMEKDYALFISFPPNYSTKDSISYPVLYVLDGWFSFPTFQGAQHLLSFGGTIEDVIIVGVSSGSNKQNTRVNRYNDYTISVDTLRDKKTDKTYGVPEGTVKSGGASKFLECLKTEIIPLVDKNYKTNNDRGISGHSLGGLFTAYCLMNSDGYFTRFGIHSPSLWWKNEELLDQTVDFIQANEIWDLPPTKVFVSVGEKEEASMVPAMMKFSYYLDRKDYKNIDLTWQVFDYETHFSVISANLSRTLSVLYGKE